MNLKTLSRTVEICLIESYDTLSIKQLAEKIQSEVEAQEIDGWKVVSSNIAPELEHSYGDTYAHLVMTLSLQRQETMEEHDKRAETARKRAETTNRRRVADALALEERDRELLKELKEKYE